MLLSATTAHIVAAQAERVKEVIGKGRRRNTFLLIIRAAGYHDAGVVRSVRWSVMSPLRPPFTSSASSTRGEAPAHMQHAHAVITETVPYLMHGILVPLATGALDNSQLGLMNIILLKLIIGIYKAGVTWKDGK